MIVNATVDLLPKNDTYEFTDGWDFEIDGFKFSKKDAHTISVTYAFETELIKEDEIFGRVHETPDDLNEELLQKEYELEILLDVITISTGTGLRISPDTYTFSYRGGSSRSSSSSKIDLHDEDSIKERFHNLKEAPDNVQDAFRFYRLNRLEEDGGERSTQLWSVVERLYGKQPDQKFLEEAEFSALKDFINSSEVIHEDKKVKLIESLGYINPINTLDLLAERIRLKNTEGQVSAAEKKALLREWKKLRGYQGHGEYVLRSENLQDTLWDFEDTVELFLENHIRPKMYVVVAFKDGSLADEWKKTPSHWKVGAWNFTPVRQNNPLTEARILERAIDGSEAVFVIDYKKIFKVTPGKSEEVQLAQLDKEFLKEVEDIRKAMMVDESQS